MSSSLCHGTFISSFVGPERSEWSPEEGSEPPRAWAVSLDPSEPRNLEEALLEAKVLLKL